MASNDWEIIFEGLTADQRAEQKGVLLKELNNLYLSQSQGGKSYQRSITDVKERLAALTRVENWASGKSDQDYTLADFSK